MKKLLSTTAMLLISSAIFGQVGINTANPRSTLDVNGDARVRTINPANTPDYILAADTNGVLRKTTLSVGDLDGSSDTSGVSIQKQQYFGTIADPNQTINAGVIEIRLYPVNGTSTTDVYPQIRLRTAPASNIDVIVLDEETWLTAGQTSSVNTFNGSAGKYTFTTTNWDIWKNIGSVTMALNEKNVLTFAVPGTKDLYRATCYVVINSAVAGQERLYNLILEKF
ncbi:hypothetical protein [Chryseobacterium shigense]|uniref:Uncharacterized protein n=1 Tax=Chryseobacterium shigense TaxID=297244 RepID=A0A841MXB2_9FLAO|nr:hypothetical protein [Chryseobacterium shigense]MBB6369174.1 hypothetical protein [Chryseobacterium shigense]